MSLISFRCEACGRTLRIGADKAGRRARCPHCQKPLTIPEAEAPPAQKATPSPASLPPAERIADSEGDEHGIPHSRQAASKSSSPRTPRPPLDHAEPAPDVAATGEESAGVPSRRGKDKSEKSSRRPKRRVRRERAAWRKVLFGVALVALSIVWTLLAALVGLVAGLLGATRFLAILQVIGFVFQVMALVGYAFCLAVPPRHYARTFALATLILASAGLLVDIGSGLAAWRQEATAGAKLEPEADDDAEDETPRSTAAQALDLAKGLLVDYGRHIAFVLFLWAVAQMYEGNALIRDATHLLVLAGMACAWWALDSLLSLVRAGQVLHTLAGLIGLDLLCGLGWRLLRLAMLGVFLRLLYNTLIVLQSKATGEPVLGETDREALRHLPVERPDELR